MDDKRDAEIRHRAHQIWENEGKPEGKEADHWDRAAREVQDKNGAGGTSRHGSAVKSAAEGSEAVRVADDLKSGGSAPKR